MTRQLLSVEKFDGQTLEPAAGDGAIFRVLVAAGMPATAYDVETDFLRESRRFENVITNPPYSLAFEFVLKAKTVAASKIALLLPLSYLHGRERHEVIWTDNDFPLKAVYVFTRYPMLGEPLRQDGKYHTGMMVYGWFVWERMTEQREPVIRWIDNHEYVLRKGE